MFDQRNLVEDSNNSCRYEKSSWSECSPNGEMSRTDLLKANSDPTCDKSRRIVKKCNKNKQTKATKDKGKR
ncbi:Pleiotrophin-like protein [Operophtera brumata]|uniref:Pleiotrophin-like protein n=1 Tax=Operophtera brumata TaxID=104452 RepID=A0A0L7KUE3_OPEBR|nr:Pleiotrophin-like protein [Operophtera brumata]